MQVRLALGTELDVATSGEVSDGLNALGDRLSKPPPLPTFTDRIGADFVPAGGAPLIIDLGKPPTGRTWNLLSVTTFGVDDATVTANAKVALYCGDAQNPTLIQLKVPALTVPTFLSLTKGVLWCLDSQNMFARVTGAAALAPIGVIVPIAEWRECDVVARNGR